MQTKAADRFVAAMSEVLDRLLETDATPAQRFAAFAVAWELSPGRTHASSQTELAQVLKISRGSLARSLQLLRNVDAFECVQQVRVRRNQPRDCPTYPAALPRPSR